jgi:mono/diheme cytochrome c family protein
MMGGNGRVSRSVLAGVLLIGALPVFVQPVDAHKPVTSQYTFTEDVYPIVKERCGACHAPNGVAPMSLLTYDDARPWAESIRLELASGHMPPWFGDPGFAELRDLHQLSPRDIDVVLTWVTGGTPRGPESPTPAGPARNIRSTWRRGRPDIALPLPAVFSLPADKTEDTQEFVLDTARARDRFIAAADLLPGNPAVVHDAVIFTRGPGGASENVLAAWLPGSAPVTAETGVGFRWRAGEVLVVRIHYKKTWKYEHKPATDRSTVGLYLMKAPAGREVASLDVPVSGGVVDEDAQALAVRSDGARADVDVRIVAVRPDGSRVAVIGFVARAGWGQRYWLARPLLLPKGTRLDVRTTGAVSSSMRIWIDVARPAS